MGWPSARRTHFGSFGVSGMSLALPRVWPLESCLYCRHQRPKPSSLLCRFAEQRRGCSLYSLNCLVNFPPNLEHDSSKKIMFSMSYTLFPWRLAVEVGTSRGAWQACGPTHRPHTGDSPVPLSCASAWMAILLHSGEPTSPTALAHRALWSSWGQARLRA